MASRLTGLNWRELVSLGILMNTRGLMELIVLNVGMDLGVLSPILLAMLVIMAVVMIVATMPVIPALTEASVRAGMAQAFRKSEWDSRPSAAGFPSGPTGVRHAIDGQDPV